jgi:hypothetical protein
MTDGYGVVPDCVCSVAARLGLNTWMCCASAALIQARARSSEYGRTAASYGATYRAILVCSRCQCGSVNICAC